MSAEAAIATRSWTAGRYTCTLTMQRPRSGAIVNATIEWSPERPRCLSDDEMTAYRLGRNKALAEISSQLGINAAVLEL